MTAYEDDHGRVVVVRDGDPVPPSWRRLDAGFRQDPRAIELEKQMSDQIAGLSSACLSTDEARAVVNRQLTELGLQGWSIADKREDVETSCAYASLEDRTVTPLPSSDVATPPQWVTAFSGDVRGAVFDRCLSRVGVVPMSEQSAVGAAGEGLRHAFPTTRHLSGNWRERASGCTSSSHAAGRPSPGVTKRCSRAEVVRSPWRRRRPMPGGRAVEREHHLGRPREFRQGVGFVGRRLLRLRRARLGGHRRFRRHDVENVLRQMAGLEAASSGARRNKD